MTRIAFLPQPPSALPLSDLLLLEQLQLRLGLRVCAIGIGDGETAARIAGLCSQVTGFEACPESLASLGYLERLYPNLRLIAADVTDERTLRMHAGGYDCAISCDRLHAASEPAAFLRGVGTLLVPGGEAAVTFPHRRADGSARFESAAELRALLAEAGLVEARIGAARLSRHAERIARRLGWRPSCADAPGGARLDRVRRTLAPVVNLWWYCALHWIAARGPSFAVDWEFRATPFDDCQVFCHARKAGPEAVAA
jgi:SAM-dependent methyltransferase